MSTSFKMKLDPITLGKRDVHGKKNKENTKIGYKIQTKIFTGAQTSNKSQAYPCSSQKIKAAPKQKEKLKLTHKLV